MLGVEIFVSFAWIGVDCRTEIRSNVDDRNNLRQDETPVGKGENSQQNINTEITPPRCSAETEECYNMGRNERKQWGIPGERHFLLLSLLQLHGMFRRTNNRAARNAMLHSVMVSMFAGFGNVEDSFKNMELGYETLPYGGFA